MKTELLDRTMVDSDLGVVNAARCSFDKESKWEDTSNTSQEGARILSKQDERLIHYLAKNNHWTPFAHAQEIFYIYMLEEELMDFFLNANLSGFEWQLYNKHESPNLKTTIFLHIRGSLYAWLTNILHLPADICTYIHQYLLKKYPYSSSTISPFLKRKKENCIRCENMNNIIDFNHELKPFTFRLHVPIFVKRQLETHRRNFVMTDIEDFSQNEVSRRYVDNRPEIYFPKEWRLQHKQKKQGSSDEVLTGVKATLMTINYDHHIHNGLLYYEKFNESGVAHELSRMILPLSTYTTFWWTGSLKSWERMFKLRLDSHAQSETREIAQMCYEEIQKHV